jgi:flagellar hook-basal body complex protein FliE
MNIVPVSGPAPIPSAGGALSAGGSAAPSQSFGDFLARALDNLSALENGSDQLSATLAAGGPVDIHSVVIANEQTSIAFQLALQVRNRVVEAYQDVMRMQV